MLLAIFLAGAILWNLPWSNYDNVLFVSAVEPGYLDFDNLPDTNFSCDGKVIGGYYADTETGCQMFHVCTIGQKSEITDIKFLCLNGTVFDQETRVCERLDEVDCSRSESFFDLNLELYGNNGGGYGIQPEDDGKEHESEHCEEDYEDEANSCHKKTPANSTEPNDAEYDWEESTAAAPVSQPPSTSSTAAPTTARPTPISSPRPSTSPPPKFLYQHPELSRPPTTADTSLQLLALHESFQQNIKQQDAAKLRPINVAPTPAKNSTAFSFSKTAYPTFASPKPTYPLPKLPNTFSNLSHKPSFASSLANSNRAPPSAPPSYFAKHSQKVTLGPVAQKQPEAPVLFAYKIVGDGRPFRPPVYNPSPAATEAPLAQPTFHGRPFTFRPLQAQFAQQQRGQEKDEDYEAHTNFARAIGERPKGNGSDAVSVVLRTSSVSSSISSKPQSAILNSTHPQSGRGFAPGATSSMRPNITEINEALTEEPYYEEGEEAIEYDENSPEYKDIVYPSDVRKIRQR